MTKDLFERMALGTESDLVSEVRQLRSEIAELRADMNGRSSVIITGREATDAFRDLLRAVRR